MASRARTFLPSVVAKPANGKLALKNEFIKDMCAQKLGWGTQKNVDVSGGEFLLALTNAAFLLDGFGPRLLALGNPVPQYFQDPRFLGHKKHTGPPPPPPPPPARVPLFFFLAPQN